MKLKRLGALATTLALTLSMTALPAHAVEFNDVPADYWGHADISKMSDAGYAKGYEDGSFKPEGKMTAAETLLFCARATGVASDVQTKIAAARAEEMEEVIPESIISWTAKEMAVAVETGVITIPELEALAQAGALTKTITRESICMYLVRAMQLEPLARGLTNYFTLERYQDRDQISPALAPYVHVLTNFGIVKGTPNGTFDPKGAVTRAQMTTMLSRALDFMEGAGITTELPEYTTYDWRAGTIAAVTPSADGSTILTINSEFTGSQSFALSAAVKVYEDNMLTTVSSMKPGQYVRLNLTNGGVVKEARLGGTLTTYTGAVSSLAEGQLSILVSGVPKNLTIDRFTQVMAGKNAGDRNIIDEDAGYTSAVCFVDEMGHLAGVKFIGGTQLVSGLVEGVTTAGGVTTLGVTQFNGVVYRYTIPAGIAVTVNGVLGSLSAKNVGDYVDVRVSNDTNEAASIAVNTVSHYVQGPIKKLGTVGTARSIYLTDQFTGKEVSYVVSPEAVITYNGETVTMADIQSGWYATVRVAGDSIAEIRAFSGSVTVEGTLTAITYGAKTVLTVTGDDDSTMTYSLDIERLPTINREGKASSLDKLRTGDHLVITIRYNKVEKIDTTAQTANLTGTISKISMDTDGVTMDVKLSTGDVVSYTVSEGVSVTQGSSISNIYSLKPGYTVALVTNGEEVISIEVTATAASTTTLNGTVLLTSTAGNTRAMTLQVTDAMGKETLVNVDVKGASLLDMKTGSSVSLSSFDTGSVVTAYGGYNGATFVAKIVIRQ